MSDWSKVTRPIPVPNELSRPFWDAAKQHVLALQRCQACGHFQHPPYATCVSCMGIDLKFEPVSGKGAIYAYTIMYHAGDKRFAAAIPFASIIVELDDAPGALLAGNLLEADDDELRRFERSETDHDVHHTQVDVCLCRRLLVALHEVRLFWRRSLECALGEQAVHEGAHVEANLRPQRLVVWLENHPLRAAIKTLLVE